MVISVEEAQKLAQAELEGIAASCGEALALLPEHTVVRPLVFAFFYQSQEFIRTGKLADQLAGNGPLLVNRLSGGVVVGGTAFPPEHYIKELEAKLSVERRL